MVRSLARQRSFQLLASMAKTRVAFWQRRLLVALRSLDSLEPVDLRLRISVGLHPASISKSLLVRAIPTVLVR